VRFHVRSEHNANIVLHRLLLHLLLLARKQCVNLRIELIATLQEIQFQNEEISEDLTAEFLNEGSSCGCRATFTKVSKSFPICKEG
jgi:hypothetical protein